MNLELNFSNLWNIAYDTENCYITLIIVWVGLCGYSLRVWFCGGNTRAAVPGCERRFLDRRILYCAAVQQRIWSGPLPEVWRNGDVQDIPEMGQGRSSASVRRVCSRVGARRMTVCMTMDSSRFMSIMFRLCNHLITLYVKISSIGCFETRSRGRKFYLRMKLHVLQRWHHKHKKYTCVVLRKSSCDQMKHIFTTVSR